MFFLNAAFFQAVFAACMLPCSFANESPIVDGRQIAASSDISQIHKEHVTEVLLDLIPAETWVDHGIHCTPDLNEFRIIDIASGNFIPHPANQSAVLFTFCQPGHNFGENGIAIIAENKVIGLVVYSGGWDHRISALPDINRDGRMEIRISGGGMNQGEIWSTSAIIGFSDGGVTSYGRIADFSDDCENPYGRSGKEAAAIFVDSGPEPVFWRQTFLQPCDRQEGWQMMEKRQRFTLEADDVDYRRIK